MIEYRVFTPKNENDLMSYYDYGKQWNEPIRFFPADDLCLFWTEDEIIFSYSVAKYQDIVRFEE